MLKGDKNMAKCNCPESCTCGCKDGKECTCGCQEGKECTCNEDNE